ncbi:ABC transporter permease [Agriterribacter sp.]|uniref:ABC transporter permease n=1 Tax=Agriterribacter sp. TaxID=2821509 RepID=UPI002C1F23C0|nr:ABC transporter permease [Agriterribacter sp.]HRP54860.1 ABC transporter permease [Agriterribacter sp.]
MIKNYFKTAWMHLLKNKYASFINIFGLATGITFASLIGLWIHYETSFDSFHRHGDRIALVLKHSLFNGKKNTQEATPMPLHDELKNNYPEVEHATRIDWGGMHSLAVENGKFSKNGRFADPDFLQMFTFPVIKGNLNTALNDPSSIVLTASLAKALFGDADPMGRIIRFDNEYDLKVTGVMKDAPANSTIRFDYIVPYAFAVQTSEFIKNNSTNWGNNFMMNMVELKKGASMGDFSKKIGQLNTLRDPRMKNQTLFLHPMFKWHLYNDYKDWVNTGGKIEYIRLFGLVGIFILLIACINFMNLATARSEKRAKEVGIRKALGSSRRQLIIQFFSESILTSVFAFLLALGLIQLLLPYLKNIGFENIHFDLSNLALPSAVLLVAIAVGFFSGVYPALYLSSFVPVSVLKGIFKQGNRAIGFRKILVVMQFSISIGLIIGTIIVVRQINHAKDRPIGYDPNNLINIAASNDLAVNFQPLKNDLLNSGYIASVAKASQPMTSRYNSWSDFSWDGKDPDADIAIDAIMTEWDFEKTVKLKFIEGRPFSRAYKTDSNAVILNEAALKTIGYQNPIGKTIQLGDRTLIIVGIVENIVLLDPFKAASPLAIIFNGNSTSNVNTIFLRLKATADLKKALAAVKPVFEKYNPSMPFEYSFTDEEFAKKFTTENQVAKLSGVFSVLAIFISCLGLFGLATFMAERRAREIGIRKVLGASVMNLWILLSNEFTILVSIACLIACPLSYWIMHSWLEDYDYRIHIGWQVFVLAASLALIIALVTVSFQAVKAAVANPVKSLRSE